MNLNKVKIVLASSSPRRIQLLNQAGFRCHVVSPKVKEARKTGESAQQMVLRLSSLKAQEVLGRILSGTLFATNKQDVLVIAADTTVVHPELNKVLEKPKSLQESKKMIQALSGKTHQVKTGYSVFFYSKGKIKSLKKCVTTQVKIRKLDSNEISAYVQTREGMDKAGAYAAQGIGMGLIESIRGSYTNVVGLPMAELIQSIKKITGSYVE